MSAIECVLATRFRPSFVIHARSPDGAERNPGPIMTLHCRSRITLRSIRATKKIKREAKRRQTRRPTSVPYGHGSRETSRARLSASRRGAYGSEPTPPLSSRRASWDAAEETGVIRPRLSQSSDLRRRPVIMPAGRFPGTARERPAKPPAGTALAPCPGVPREHVPMSEQPSCNRYGDECQAIVTNIVTTSPPGRHRLQQLPHPRRLAAALKAAEARRIELPDSGLSAIAGEAHPRERLPPAADADGFSVDHYGSGAEVRVL